MKLFIAEKPSVAKAIIGELGAIKKYQGYVECRGANVVTWCFGHLLEQAEPDYYTPENVPVSKKTGKKLWRMEDLPIFPTQWKLLPKSDKGVKAQLKVIKTLLAKADSVVNCGDPDREGQLLVDEILEFYNCKKPVSRFWVSAQDSTSIRKGLQTLKPNINYQGMKLAALGRSRADWLLGMNLTRVLTLSNNKLIAVGRVQTPTLALVANRDAQIKNFQSIPFYTFKAKVSSKNKSFLVSWVPSDNQKGLDDSNRLTDKTQALNILKRLQFQRSAKVIAYSESIKKVLQPKPYSLADIQLEASNKYGFSAQETLDTCQSLYEKHKCTSYPRSDCQYLPETQFTDAPEVIAAIEKNCPLLASISKKSNTTIKSEAWNDKKVTAHHGIIPTRQIVNWEDLNDQEQKIFLLVAKRYLAQFFEVHQFLSKKINIQIENETFSAIGKLPLKQGWKALYANEKDENEEKDTNQEIPALSENEVVSVLGVECKQEMTKPPKSFTEGTLIAAMEKIHTVVENPEHKKLLRQGDGIGTPATRAAIITELKKKKYLQSKGKLIHATELGVELLGLVPDLVKNPVLTAIFERKLQEVENGKGKLDEFLATQRKFIVSEINKAKSLGKV